MHDHINEKISQFLDNELDADQSMAMLQQLLLDNELKNRLLRYQAIGQALKTETFIAPRTDFLDRIHEEIAQEPAYLIPQRKPVKFKPQHKMLALVASAALIAVILPKQMTTITGSPMKASSGGMTFAQRQASRHSENVIKQASTATPLNAQFNEYLKKHSEDTAVVENRPEAPVAKVSQ